MTGQEAVHPLVTLLPAGSGAVCEGDACSVPGADAFAEVPD